MFGRRSLRSLLWRLFGGVTQEEFEQIDEARERNEEPDYERCMEMEASGHGVPIEVKVFHAGDPEMADMIRRYLTGCLVESFGDVYRVDVTVADDAVPDGVNTLNEFHEYTEGLETAKDCNILVVNGNAYGGGSHAVAPEFHLDQIDYDDCARLSGPGDGHQAINQVIHELGHCLGLPHAHESWIPERFEGMITPMATEYVEGNRQYHAFHPDISAGDLDIVGV